MSVRDAAKTETPDTSIRKDHGAFDAEVAHEGTLRYFVENTELGVLDKDQMGIISLVNSCDHIGVQLPATKCFFTADKFSIRALSSGEEGKGRVQAKECITAGAFPMSLLYAQQDASIIEKVKSLFGRGQNQQQQQAR